MLYPKYQKYLKTNNLKPVPNDWESFVALTKIRSGGEMKQFKPYPYQLIFSELMDRYNNLVVVKSRQLGVTQTAIGKFLHRASLNPAYCGMAFMRNGDDASALSRRTRQMVDGLREYIKPDNDNVGYLKLKGLGEIHFKNSSAEGSRSYDSVLDFLFDEAAFSENIHQIYSASSPSGALAGDLITKMIVSTPSAKSGFYWDKLNENNNSADIEQMCADVADEKLYKDIPGLYWFVDKLGSCKIILHYKCHPIYRENPDYLEYRLQQDATDWETVQREYNLKFVDSAVAVFNSELIRECAIAENESDVDFDADYYCGLDCSTFGSDYTVFTVLKYKYGVYSLVEMYRKRYETSDYHIYQISNLINKYCPKKVGIEITGGVGQVYLEQLSRSHKHIKFEAIRTTGDTKPVMISNLVLALEKGMLIYPAKSPLIDEMLSFRRQGMKLEAASGKHDDIVLAVSFALAVTDFSRESKNPFKFIK